MTYPFDRQSPRRGDAAFIRALWERADARILAFLDGKPLIWSSEDRSRAGIRWLASSALPALAAAAEPPAFLGTAADGAGYFAMHIPAKAATDFDDGLGPALAVDLRSLMSQGVLSPQDVAIASTALSLLTWHAEAMFCGRCGGPTEHRDAGWKRHCAPCGKDWFPRVDPVVIMLVTDGDRCVLAREPRFPERMVSTIAGFLEPGETVEQAVARETAEEIGVHVERVSYLATQAWPFPHSLMIGCFAWCAPAPLQVDPQELCEAHWVTRDEVRQMLDGRHPRGLWLPGPHAIAHRLARAFAEQGAV